LEKTECCETNLRTTLSTISVIVFFIWLFIFIVDSSIINYNKKVIKIIPTYIFKSKNVAYVEYEYLNNIYIKKYNKVIDYNTIDSTTNFYLIIKYNKLNVGTNSIKYNIDTTNIIFDKKTKIE